MARPQRGAYRSIFSVLFDDPDYQRLSSQARLVLITARQCRQAGPAAIYRYYLDTLAAQCGLPPSVVTRCLGTLQEQGWVEFDDAVLWIRNGLRYDPSMSMANPKHRTAIERQLMELPKSPVVINFCDYYQFAYPYACLSIPIRNTEDRRLILKTDPEPENYTVGLRPTARLALEFLNTRTGRHYQAVPANLELIMARLRDGATLPQLRAVIARKTDEWQGDAKMAKYLRPATIFNRTNFAQYQGELPATAFTNGDGDASLS